MKFLLLVLVIAVAYMFWRNGRIARNAAPPSQARPPAPPQDMVSCAHCAVHLPRADAVAGTGGALYCSPEHRLLGDGRKG